MAKVPSPDALIEARRPFRVYVLRQLIELQTGTNSEKLIPLTAIMDGEVSNYELRLALRGLYRLGLVKAGSGGYRATQKGQHIYRMLQLKQAKQPHH